MQEAVRPHIKAGVALVGASVIAASMVSPAPDIQLPDLGPALHGAQLGLTAVTNPLEVYERVFGDAINNIGTLADNAMPGQVLQQLLTNQLDSLDTLGGALGTAVEGIGTSLAGLPAVVETAAGQLAAGDIVGAANTLLLFPVELVFSVAGDVLPAVETVLLQPLQNLQNIISTFLTLNLETELLLGGFVAPLISTPAAAAVALQNIVTAALSLNPLAVASAIVTAPAIVADGLLNGNYGPDLGPLVGSPFPTFAGGLLASPDLIENPDGTFITVTGGPFASIQEALEMLADALGATTTPAARVAQSEITSVPDAEATTFALTTSLDTADDVSPTEEVEPTSDAVADDAAGDDAAADGAVVDATDESVDTTPAGVNDAAKEAESDDTTTASTTKVDDASDDETTVKDVKDVQEVSDVSDVDVTTGNKVEPKTSADDTKASEDHATAGDDATTEQAGTAADSTTSADTDNSADNDSADSDSE